MQDFYPQEIFVESTVADSPKVKSILAKYPGIPVHVVADKRDIKQPQMHSRAKKQLYLARFQGSPIKTCQGLGDYVCCQYFTIALISDCHLECTYCILQDYLQNNPVITFFVNTEEILAEVEKRVLLQPNRMFRIGTGELSDSLALDHITEFSKDLCDFVKRVPNVVIELKTKTANVKQLLDLDHQKRMVVSWSVNPESYIKKEEHKCDTLSDRLHAARLCADKGFPVAFHLDPLLYFDDWNTEYSNLIDTIAANFKDEEIAWISLGSLRFTPGLKKISQERFPKSTIMSAEIFPSQDGKMRYFRPLREEMYLTLTGKLQEKLGKTPHYLCMETKTVWKNVFGQIPEKNSDVERHVAQKFLTDSVKAPENWISDTDHMTAESPQSFAV